MDDRLISQSDDSYKWIELSDAGPVSTPADTAILTVQLRDLRATTLYPTKSHD
jgi:hypothetical protein